MEIAFYGAAQTVTGSQHLLDVNGKKILLDGIMTSDERGIMAGYYGGYPATAVTPTTGRSSADEKARSVVFLVLASPEFQMA